MPADRPISDLFAQHRPVRSLEFFPPKDDAGMANLHAAAHALKHISPDFVSVTYGAGGSTRERTHGIVKRMVEETGLSPAGHITCVAATKAEINQVDRKSVV